MTGKSLCCCTYWTNTETPIVFGRNVTGLSQAWEPCCLCSDPIPFLNVFTYKRQITNNGILTDSRGRACPHADAAGATHSNSYLHIHASSSKGGTEAETIDTFFISMTNGDMNKTKVFWIHLTDAVTMNCVWTFSLLLCSKSTPDSCNEVIIMFSKVCFKSQKSQKEIGDGGDSFFLLPKW